MKTEPIESVQPQHLLTRFALRVATRIFSAALLSALLGAVLLFPADVHAATPEWLLLLGRFHPLLLHLPIGLLVLLPVLHLLARLCPQGTLRPAIAAVLWLCASSAFTAALCGLLLSQEDGYAGATLLLHRRLALLLTVLAVLLLLCESESENPCTRRTRLARRMRYAYRALLPITLMCLGVAAHLGATLTHGATFLTEHLPRPVKAWLSEESAVATHTAGTTDSAYAVLIAPILEARCTSCHGAEKSKGGLRLHTLAAILAGGDSQREEHQPTIVASHAEESLLIRAVCLPASDDAHMPPAGKPQLTPAEIATLRWWINAGADEQTPASKAPNARLVEESTPAAPRS